MEEEKDKAVNNEMKEYLEGLDVAELGRLLDTPAFTGVVLQAAVHSQQLTEKLDQLLDVEFREMSPHERESINRLAKKLHQKYAPKQAESGWLKRHWKIIAAGARQFGGMESALVLGAHQKSEPGWPFKLQISSEQPVMETRLEFGLWGMDMVVKNISDPNAAAVLIQVKSTGQTVTLKPGEKQSLGDIDEFGLTDSSDKDAIAGVLDNRLEVRTQTA